MNRVLVQWTLGSQIEKTLINVAIPSPQSRVEYFVPDIERINQVDSVRSNSCQQSHVSGLQLNDVILGQPSVLL